MKVVKLVLLFLLFLGSLYCCYRFVSSFWLSWGIRSLLILGFIAMAIKLVGKRQSSVK